MKTYKEGDKAKCKHCGLEIEYQKKCHEYNWAHPENDNDDWIQCRNHPLNKFTDFPHTFCAEPEED